MIEEKRVGAKIRPLVIDVFFEGGKRCRVSEPEVVMRGGSVWVVEFRKVEEIESCDGEDGENGKGD